MNRVSKINFFVLALSQPATEHRLEVPAAGGKDCPVARKGSASRMEQNVSEEPLLPQSIQVHQDAVCIRGFVKKVDVHGAGAGP